MKRCLLFLLFGQMGLLAYSQRILHGEVKDGFSGEALSSATVSLPDSSDAVICTEKGRFIFPSFKGDSIRISASGYESITFFTGTRDHVMVLLTPIRKELDAVVVTGTMRAVRKLESPVAVEVYTPQFLKKNPTPSIFESLQNVNGVRPQLNCSVCNTGDIHINGLEGPYTMITIDGMPIVSSLASVYGLFGIPTQLIERVEIVKGPASGLYGSEAIGGLINIITRSPDKAPLFTANVMSTSWMEHSADIGVKYKLGKRSTALLGVNYFNYQHPLDNNNDGFTDVTLQHRISFFNKINLQRKKDRVATLAGRYFYEDRWGGEMNWSKRFRGTDSIYGESIYTSRWEMIGNYQLPVNERMFFSFSATSHNQDSWYGVTPYMGWQRIGFGQMTWEKRGGKAHILLSGITGRSNYYDDNSTATIDTLSGRNKPDDHFIPGIFIQDEWRLDDRNMFLLGMRYDHHPIHKGIFTPRIAWKWSLSENQVLRLNAGTGFRVVSLFTEEHAALTGARAVEVLESLKPEKSFNVNLNYTWTRKWEQLSVNADASAWYSHFTNQIIPDYDTDPNKIIYKNLRGYSASKGMTLNLEINSGFRFKSLVGITVQDVLKTEQGNDGKNIRIRPVLTEKWSGTWVITWHFPAAGVSIDYTGNIYGPMRLPRLSNTDPRPAESPVWSIQNIQFSKLISRRLEIFGGVKNLLNWTPARNTPFIIARSHDPFDKKLDYDGDGRIDTDANGRVLVTPENPYGLTFDPAYVYAPNQGIRLFAGMRFTVKK